jgi:gluconate 2-dehydrogenase subunit 3-like protein
MANQSMSRREALKSLTLGASAGAVVTGIPAHAARQAHERVRRAKAADPGGTYTPQFFSAHQYKTLQAVCQAVLPPDERSGGAIEAGAPEFIDLLTSESKEYQLALGGGMIWLDSMCRGRYGNVYLDCSPDQQREILDLIAYRANAQTDPRLSQGIRFFALVRKMTADGFYTSQLGVQDLGYIGNDYLAEFPGCPPVPET